MLCRERLFNSTNSCAASLTPRTGVVMFAVPRKPKWGAQNQAVTAQTQSEPVLQSAGV